MTSIIHTCSKSEVGFVMKAVGTDFTVKSNLSAILSHDDPDALSSSSKISVKIIHLHSAYNIIGQMHAFHTVHTDFQFSFNRPIFQVSLG